MFPMKILSSVNVLSTRLHRTKRILPLIVCFGSCLHVPSYCSNYFKKNSKIFTWWTILDKPQEFLLERVNKMGQEWRTCFLLLLQGWQGAGGYWAGSPGLTSWRAFKAGQFSLPGFPSAPTCFPGLVALFWLAFSSSHITSHPPRCSHALSSVLLIVWICFKNSFIQYAFDIQPFVCSPSFVWAMSHFMTSFKQSTKLHEIKSDGLAESEVHRRSKSWCWNESGIGKSKSPSVETSTILALTAFCVGNFGIFCSLTRNWHEWLTTTEMVIWKGDFQMSNLLSERKKTLISVRSWLFLWFIITISVWFGIITLWLTAYTVIVSTDLL